MTPNAKKRTLRELIEEQGGACFYCGRPFAKRGHLRPTLDHKLPQWLGGRWERRNLVAACLTCNAKKGPLDHETYMRVRDDGRALKLEVRKAHVMAKRAAAGWLERETEAAVREVARWPAWMKRAADLYPYGRPND